MAKCLKRVCMCKTSTKAALLWPQPQFRSFCPNFRHVCIGGFHLRTLSLSSLPLTDPLTTSLRPRRSNFPLSWRSEHAMSNNQHHHLQESFHQNPNNLGAKNQCKIFLRKVFPQPFRSWTSAPKIMDVRTKKCIFPAAPVVGRNFLTPGHPGVRVGNVRGKSGPKNVCLCCCFSSLTNGGVFVSC